MIVIGTKQMFELSLGVISHIFINPSNCRRFDIRRSLLLENRYRTYYSSLIVFSVSIYFLSS